MPRLMVAGLIVSCVLPLVAARAQQPALTIHAAGGPAWLSLDGREADRGLAGQLGISHAVSDRLRIGVHALGWTNDGKRFFSLAPTVGVAVAPRGTLDFHAGIGLGYRRWVSLCPGTPIPGCDGARTDGTLNAQVGLSSALRSLGPIHPRLDFTYHATLRKLDASAPDPQNLGMITFGVGLEWAR